MLRLFCSRLVKTSKSLNSSRVLNSCNKRINCRAFSTDIPEDFYNDKDEDELQFLDLAKVGKLQDLTKLQTAWTWENILAEKDSPINLAEADTDLYDEDFDENEDFTPGEELIIDRMLSSESAKQIGDFENSNYIRPEHLNFNVEWKKPDEETEPLLEKFIPDTDPHKYSDDSQGLRSCPGKLQRRGKTPSLQCHKIDLLQLHHLDVILLQKYLTEDGEILGKKDTGLCSKCQRKVAKTIKRSRSMGIIPHLGQFKIRDSKPLAAETDFHNTVNGVKLQSRSIL